MPAALEGVRIADFSRVLAGPLATMVLADLGAEVVKIERPGGGDDTRSWGPPFDEAGRATYFESINRNKRSLVIDLRSAEGRERARELVRGCEVLVENFRPGVMESFGLGYAQLREAHPRLVYCSITGFGAGAGAGLPGYDLLVQALGGLMSITGAAGGEPQKVGVALVDVVCGLFASVGILAALREAERSGEGQHVEVDLLSSLLAALVNQASAYTVAGVVAQRMGNAHPSIAPYELLRCADGMLVLAVGTDEQFASLARVLGDDSLAGEAAYATNRQRVVHRDGLRERLERALAHRGSDEWVRALTAAGVPAGAVNDISQAFALAERLGLEPIVSLARPDGTSVSLPRNPIGLSRTPAAYRSAPPALGEGPAGGAAPAGS